MNRVVSIANKLHSIGIEKRPDEVYSQILDDSGGYQDVAKRMMEAIDTDVTIFSSFVIHISGGDVQFVCSDQQQKEHIVYGGNELGLFFIVGVVVGMLIISWFV